MFCNVNNVYSLVKTGQNAKSLNDSFCVELTRVFVTVQLNWDRNTGSMVAFESSLHHLLGHSLLWFAASFSKIIHIHTHI